MSYDPNDPWGLNQQQNPYMQPQPGQDPAMQQQPMQPPAGAAPQQGYNMDPAVMNAMLGMRGNQAAAGKVARQQKMADMLRADAAKANSGGQMVGGRYIGPNAVTAIGQGLAGVMGGKMDATAGVQQDKNIASDKDAMERLMRALQQQRGGQGGGADPMAAFGGSGY